MSNIFTLPVARGTYGDQFYFFLTGTTTPQDVYTDVDLQVAHTQPVEADAAGFFPVIYLDPSAPAYRWRWLDINNVAVRPDIDDVVSSGDESASYRIKGTSPTLIFEETDAAANEGKWKIKASGGILSFSLLDDAEATENQFMAVFRTGGGDQLVQLAGLGLGTFTGTLTDCTSVITEEVAWSLSGGVVTMVFPLFSGVSNATAKTISGIPNELRPSVAAAAAIVVLNDNDADLQAGIATMAINESAIRLFPLDGAGAWPNTGSCAVQAFSISWRV